LGLPPRASRFKPGFNENSANSIIEHARIELRNQDQPAQAVLNAAQKGGIYAALGKGPAPEPPSVQELAEKYGMSPEEAQLMDQVIKKVQHERAAVPHAPPPGVSEIMRALQVGTNISAGYMKGMLESISHDYRSHQLTPWSYPNAIGHGFVEMPGAVKEGYNYETLIKEKTNPNSFLYRHSNVIGLPLDIVLDPTTYLSFGETSITKAGAMQVMIRADNKADAKAWQIIERGRKYQGRTWDKHEHDDLLALIRQNQGAPNTLADATLQLRKEGLEMKKAARRGEYGRVRQIGGFVAPRRIAGGRGVRFMGFQAPGTAGLGRAGAQQLRRAGAALYDTPLGTIPKLFVPNSAGRHIVNDLERARMLNLTRTVGNMQGSLRSTIFADKIADLLTSKAYTEVKHEKIIPGVPSTTGPESGLYFTHTGNLVHEGDRTYPEWNHHNIYDEHNNLQGSITWDDSPYTNEIEANTAYIRPEFRNLTNWKRLIEPVIQHAKETGKPISGLIMNEQLFNLVKRIADREGVEIKPHFLQSDFARAASNTPPRKGQQVVQVHPDRLPALATPDMIEHVVVNELMGTVNKVTPLSEREGLHKLSAEELAKSTPEQQKFMEIYRNRINNYVKKGMESGGKRAELLQKVRVYENHYFDPVTVVARLQVDQDMARISREYEKQVLEDSRYARFLGKPHINENGDMVYREDPPAGYVTYIARSGKHYAVRQAAKEALEQIKNPAFLRGEQTKWEKYTDPFGVQGWWKAMATMPNPSFHAMNLMGAMWNNMLAGIYNPMDYLKVYARVAHRSRLERSAELDQRTFRAPVRALMGKAPKSTEKGREALNVVREFEARGGGGRSGYLAELTEKSLGGGFEEAAKLASGRGIKDLIRPSAERRAKAEGKRIGATPRLVASRARQAGAVLGTPVTGGGSLLLMAPELAKLGRTFLGGPIENIVRLTPFVKFSKDPQMIRALKRVDEAYGPPRVPGYKDNFIAPTRSQQSDMYDYASEIVKRFQFDYADITDFERYIVKSIFPFYTYYRKNFVVQAQELLKQPRVLATAAKVENFLAEEAGDIGPLKELLPSYFAQLNAVQIPLPGWAKEKMGIPKNQPVFLNPKLPFVTLNMFPPLWGVFSDPHQRELTPQFMQTQLAPFFASVGPHPFGVPGGKLAIEGITGYSLGLNRPIDYQRASSNDWRQSTRDAPFYAKFMPSFMKHFFLIADNGKGQLKMPATNRYILDQMVAPFVTNYGSTIAPPDATEAQQGKAFANRVAMVTGLRLMPVDVHKVGTAYSYGVKNLLEARQSDLRQQKTAAFPGGKRLPDEDREILELVTRFTEISRHVDRERNIELYGHP